MRSQQIRTQVPRFISHQPMQQCIHCAQPTRQRPRQRLTTQAIHINTQEKRRNQVPRTTINQATQDQPSIRSTQQLNRPNIQTQQRTMQNKHNTNQNSRQHSTRQSRPQSHPSRQPRQQLQILARKHRHSVIAHVRSQSNSSHQSQPRLPQANHQTRNTNVRMQRLQPRQTSPLS